MYLIFYSLLLFFFLSLCFIHLFKFLLSINNGVGFYTISVLVGKKVLPTTSEDAYEVAVCIIFGEETDFILCIVKLVELLSGIKFI